jgi:cysteine-rich repeat protein
MGTRNDMTMRRGSGAAGLWAGALLALGLGFAATGCVKEPEAIACPTGIYCPAGMQCAAAQAACIADLCGNGVLDPGEACDDGNILDGDGCSHDCQSAGRCGDGFVNGGEECDPFLNFGETAGCTAQCKISWCGDGYTNHAANEECDDGNTNPNGDCVNCRWATCGDGFVDMIVTSSRYEQCDFGAQNTNGTDCPYGQRACQLCDMSCHDVTGTPHYCGNGIPNERRLDGTFEECDDDRSFNCGTCGRTSCVVVSRRAAQGTIDATLATTLANGDWFDLDDGTAAHAPVRFEIDLVGTCASATGNRCMAFPSIDPAGVASVIRAEISNAVSLNISATLPDGGTVITLTNDALGVTGNVQIQTSGSSVVVAPASGPVVVGGMSGGAGCENQSPCKENYDCLSNHCGSTSKVCKP